eukprot:CAMPEP_0118663976 /NCGR_PEP_ID=MMETSP0785-20121206/17747_1 /TAXON_ID=91992 /ORGANISM="Bolidomonas pacifica, Strain CCMP 1866" /LENGTH=4925 /DNA_ID=CAMNT_0006557813 /DNA_START=422 /DNA_END=15195 /DNA_ORIENTATION=+
MLAPTALIAQVVNIRAVLPPAVLPALEASMNGTTHATIVVQGNTPMMQRHLARAAAAGKISNSNKNGCDSCVAGTYTSDQVSCPVCEWGKWSASVASSCSSCDTGKYIADNGVNRNNHLQSSCQDCLAGKAQNSVQSGCDSCVAGKYAGARAGSCSSCGKGTYSFGEAPSCTVCPQGTYSDVFDTPGSDSPCTSCPQGTYNDKNTASASNHNAASTCDNCGVGTANINTRSASADACALCAAGKYSDEEALAECKGCGVGRYQASTGQTSCQQCPEGAYVNVEKTGCVSCLAGTVSLAGSSDASDCTPCQAGRYTTTNVSPCANCVEGKYSLAQATTCVDCPVGKHYTGTQGSSESVCENCGRGTYADETGTVNCKSCKAGTYDPCSSAPSSGPCTGEKPGHTSEQGCTVCPSGSYSLITDSNRNTCNLCQAGKYLSDNGGSYARRTEHDSESECLECLAGTYSPSQGSSVCFICGEGKYQSGSGKSFCEPCAIGKYNGDAATDRNLHLSPNSPSCNDCQVGKYNPFVEQNSCQNCPAGKFTGATGSQAESQCQVCADGSYSSAGSSSCTLCSPGKFLNGAGSSEVVGGIYTDPCQECELGMYQDEAGKISCKICSSGTYADTKGTGNEGCTNCPTGKYLGADGVLASDHDSSSKCSNCIPGKYAPIQGSAQCSNCPAGKTSTSPFAVCTDCPSGEYSSAEASENCDPCAPGKYAEATGASACIVCPSGSFSTVFRTVTCDLCPKGKSSTNEGKEFLVVCDDCVAGQYAPLATGSTSCEDCEVGKYSDFDGASESCELCKAGEYQELTGQVYCKNCPSGLSSVPGSIECVSCPGIVIDGECIRCAAGEYAMTGGCTPCFGGSMSIGGGTTSCTQCTPGKYSTKEDSYPAKCESGCDSCTTCAAGYVSGPVSTECTPCEAGKITDPTDPSNCMQCAPGKYTSAIGLTSCSTCDAGKFSYSGASVCTECTAGRYSGSSASSCLPCAAGSESAAGSSFCTSCTEGKYTGSDGTANCVDCPSGKISNTAGSTSCTNCVEGKISVSGASVCENCPAGKTSKPESLYRCSDCEAGQYSTEGTTCTMCANGKYTSFSSSSECLPCRSGYWCHPRVSLEEGGTDTIGSSNPEEHKCGEGLAHPASVFCREGAFAPESVQAGYFSTPVAFDEDVRQDEDACDETFFCSKGNKVAFMKWADGVCDATAIEIPEGASPSKIRSFAIGANTDSDGNAIVGLIMGPNLTPEYSVLEVIDKGTEGTCSIPSTAISVTESGLFISGNVDYESCSGGVTVVIEATGDFSNSDCYTDSKPCSNAAKSELCNVDLRITNQNEAPYWLPAQTSDRSEPCYMNSITFSVNERSAEYSEFGDNLETCVADPDEADAIKFSVDQNLADDLIGDELFDVRTCGGKLFVRPAAAGTESKLRYHMVSKTDTAANDLNNLHTVTVTAKDNGDLQDTNTISVQIVNVNDPPTWCSAVNTCTVAGKSNTPTRIDNVKERDPKNTVIYDMSAHAEDLDWDDLTFSLTKNDDDAFRIDSLGVIRSNIEFDYESKAAYYITVSVTDGDADYPPAVSDLIKVEIKDVNDPPYFNNGDDGAPRTYIEYEFAETVPDEVAGSELTTNGPTLVDPTCNDSDPLNRCARNDDGDIIADITSLAGDQDTSDSFALGTLSYVVQTTEGQVSNDFSVVTTGSKTELKVKRVTDGPLGNRFDFEGLESSFNLKLYVQDDAVMVGPVDLVLKLVDINEAPLIASTSSELQFKVVESSCDEPTFSIGDKSMAPIQNGDIVGYIEAVDVDIGQEIFMSITGTVDDELPFIIDPNSNQVTCSYSVYNSMGYVCVQFAVKLTGTLDHETKSSYGPVSIKVSDGQKEATSQFEVSVLDCNEIPVLDPDGKSTVRLKIYEDASDSNPIANIGGASPIEVTDVDSGDTAHTLTIVGGSANVKFEINNDGYFSLISGQDLDYEKINTYYAQVVAVDQQNGAACAGASGGQYCASYATSNIVTYTIDVLNRNEAPQWRLPDNSNSLYGLTVNRNITEKAVDDEVVHQMEGYDEDKDNGLGDTITYSIVEHSYVGTSSDKCKGPNDEDPVTNSRGKLCCVEKAFLKLVTSETDANIVALAVDWSAAENPGKDHPLENLEDCELVVKVSATDAGKDCNAADTNNDCSAYQTTIDSPLTSEQSQTIIFKVYSSNFSPNLKDKTYGSTAVTCTSSIASVCINENPVAGQVLVSNLTHITTDLNNNVEDESLWQSHLYKIVDQRQDFDSYSKERFVINNSTGAISVANKANLGLDYELVIGGEVKNAYRILVQVSDNGAPKLSDVASITIQLSDVNEPPIFIKGPGRFEVDEHVPYDLNHDPSIYSNGLVLTGSEIMASDEDATDQGSLVFSMPEHDYFELIQVDNGVDSEGVVQQKSAKIRLKAKVELDHEAKEEYKLNITVTDGANPPHAVPVVEEFIVYVNDINEKPQWMYEFYRGPDPKDGSNMVFSFYPTEDIEGGAFIGSVKVLDPDYPGDSIVYTITKGDTTMFKVNSDGEVRLTADATFDYEKKTKYELTIEAKEASTIEQYALTSDVIINVVDLNDMTIDSILTSGGSSQLSAGGGDWVTITGSNFGPVAADIVFDSSDDVNLEDKRLGIEAIYYGEDGIIYIPEECQYVDNGKTTGTLRDRDNTKIKCKAVAGVGQNHRWNITVSYEPGTPAETGVPEPRATWTVSGDIVTQTTSYDPPQITKIENAASMPTSGGITVTITGKNFGPVYKDCGMAISETCENYPTGPSAKYACSDTCYTTAQIQALCVDESSGCTSCNSKGKSCNRHPDLYISDAVEVWYGPSEDKITKYECKDAIVMETAEGEDQVVQCLSAEGVGSEFWWSIKVGSKDPKVPNSRLLDSTSQYSTPYYYAESSYQAPSLETVSASLLPNGAATQSTPIKITGDNLGPKYTQSDLKLTYKNSANSTYVSTDCVIIVPHKSANCSSVPGVGTDLVFQIEITGLTSSSVASSVSYKPPVIKAPEGLDYAVSGQGATDAKTSGGQEIHIYGENFGPAGDPYSPEMSYGLTTAKKYNGTGCYVSNAYNKITCLSAPGTGFDHWAKVVVGGQVSPIFDAEIAYARPSVHYFKPEWEKDLTVEGAQTPGNEWIVVHGENFGTVSNNAINKISYGPNGVEYVPCAGASAPNCTCTVIVDHEQIRCLMTAGSGKMHRWIVMIDGQNSTVSTTSYDRPSISGIEGPGAIDANCDGGESVTLSGKNFGPGRNSVEMVTYGPAGNEFTAEIVEYKSHAEIVCKTVKGLGQNLKWQVKIDGQFSDLSEITSNYEKPSISHIKKLHGYTEGGSEHVINGTNLGVNVDNSYLEIRFDGEAIILDGSSTDKVVQGESSSYMAGRAEDGVTDYIKFVLPPMSKVHQAKVVTVHVGHKHFNVDQESNQLVFNYGDPRIESIENLAGEPLGLTMLPTTNLVIRGVNFGMEKYSSIFIDNVEQPFVDSTEVAGVTEWDHGTIVMRYEGIKGDVHVKVGDTLSNVVRFENRSVELLMQYPHIPRVEGYKTTGFTADGDSNLTVAGCNLPDPAWGNPGDTIRPWDRLEMFVGGIICPVYPLSLRDLDRNAINAPADFCEGDTIREVTCKVPEGTGESNEVILKNGGNPHFTGNGTLYLKYLPPIVESFTPKEVDTKGGEVEVRGENFGVFSDKVSISMGNIGLSIKEGSLSHTGFTAIVPPGEGTPKPIYVTVDSQMHVTQRDDPDVFRYLYPIIETVTPTQLDTKGGEVSVTGIYFGREGKAKAFLLSDDASTVLPYDVSIIEYDSVNQDDMTVSVSAGQGLARFALNVSGNVENIVLPYKRPSLDTPAGGQIIMNTEGGANVTITGSNFGIGRDYAIEIREVGGSDSNFPVNIYHPSKSIHHFTHESLVFVVPEGQNTRDNPMELILNVAGQTSDPITVNYGQPNITSISMCFSDSIKSVYTGPCELNDDDTMVALGSDCDPYDGANGGCGLRTDGGYTVALFGVNFGKPDAGLQKVFFRGKALVNSAEAVPGDKEAEVHYISHREVRVRIPPGVGMNIPIKFSIGSRESSPTLFSYDPPYVEDISPEKPNAEGDVVTIHGSNFGPTLEDAGEINIMIGQKKYVGNETVTEWLPCLGPSFGMDLRFPIWQQKGSGTPYLWCELPRVKVGPKDVRVSVAKRNVTVTRDASDFSPKCQANFYGQQQDGIFWGPILDMCGEQCTYSSGICLDSWNPDWRIHMREECVEEKHCQKILDLNDKVQNCTVISREDEYCRPCPGGSTCEVNTQFNEEPVAQEGYWRLDVLASPEACGEDYNERNHRTTCYDVVPCNPSTACEGENKCNYGYTGVKCDFCCDMMHRYITDHFGRKIPNPECTHEDGSWVKYFRQYGECAPCPSNPWMIVALLVGGLSVFGTIAYIMKKKHVSLGIFSIAVDYLQILTLLSATKTPWPRVILDLYTWLSAFNFNINITAPECAFELAYEDKWKMIMIMPLFILSGVVVYNYARVLVNKYFLNKHGKDVYAHSYRSWGIAVTIMYYIYLNLSMTALEIFNCSTVELEDPMTGEIVTDGKQYMSETNWVCYEDGSLQVTLIPHACIAIGVYTVGYPLYVAWIVLPPLSAKKCREDQILRAQDLGYTRKTNPHCYEHRLCYSKLYYYYKPKCWYWTLMVLLKKFSIATISLMFRANATFQMCMIVLMIFIAAVMQVRNQPYMSMSEREEVLKEHKDAVAQFNADIEMIRGGSMIERKKKFNLGTMSKKEAGYIAAEYFWNYNTVETVLLGSSILVNLFGIMFESQFLKEGTYAHETLANVTLTVIIVSLVYVLIVVWSEVVAAVFPSLDLSFVNRFANKDTKGEDDVTMEDRDSTVMALEMKALELTANPLFSGRDETRDGVGELREEDMIKAVKTHPEYIRMASSLRDLNKSLQHAKEEQKHAMAKGVASNFKIIVMKG